MSDSEAVILKKKDIARLVCESLKDIKGMCYEYGICDRCGSCDVCKCVAENLIKNSINPDVNICIFDLSKPIYAETIEHASKTCDEDEDGDEENG